MSAADRVVSLQCALDRLIRRGDTQAVAGRRFLIVQIDGLSRSVLRMGLQSGSMPFLRQLLQDGYRLEPMTVGLPTTTPSFQMAAMYGVAPDIPGFHYYDRARRGDIHFPRSGHAAWVEGKQTSGRRGILEGGSAYGCVFTGGARRCFYNLAGLGGRGRLAALSPFVVLAWVCLQSAVRTIVELVRALPGFIARPGSRREDWRWLVIKVGLGIWVRRFFTLAVARDLRAGTPAIYVNYLDYDKAAHAFGPRSRPALHTLRWLDATLRELWQVAGRVPEHRYDLYILSDHGQVPCSSYLDLTDGARFELRIFDELLGQFTAGADGPRDELEAHQQGNLRIICAGLNAFLYVLDADQALDADALDRRFPHLAERLSERPGVGLVLARSSAGPVCYWRGKRYPFRDAGPRIFASRADAGLVVESVEALVNMPSAGDLVIYGSAGPAGHVSFLRECGGHAGLSPDEMHTFLVHSSQVPVPAPLHNPLQLYDHFIRYRPGPSGST